MRESTRTYQIAEFAELAGVTVKALHHYDRLGLLKPRRTGAGYRLYRERDLERLQQIVTLQFLGLPLRQIKHILEQPGGGLGEALALQRQVLAVRQQALARAVSAIEEAERLLVPGQPTHPNILKKLIEVIGMEQNGMDALKQYFDESAWGKVKPVYESGPSREWKNLFREVAAALEEDPEGAAGRALAERWLALSSTDPLVLAGGAKAWADRAQWPPELRERTADLEAVSLFIRRAIAAHRRKYYSEGDWARLEQRTPEERERAASAWQSLFLDANGALDEDPAGERAQSIAARWMELVAHQPRVGAASAWADREHWPEGAKRQIAAFNLEKVAGFVTQAMKLRARGMQR